MKTFISFSGGIESRTMAILFGNKADALFADTGSEHKILYQQLDDVEKKIRLFHNNNFKIIRVRNVDYDSLEAYIRQRKFFPGFGNRFCTHLFKIAPIDDYLMQFKDEGVELMIGLNVDELDYRIGNYGLLPFVRYSYPLIENNINRKMCIDILHSAKIFPNFPAYMKRGGCKFCYFKSKAEYHAMAILNEQEYDEVANLESEIQDKREKFFHIVPSITNLTEFKRYAKSVMFNSDEIYPMVNDLTRCGVFCNR
jgi:hypothetical protein